MQDLLPMGVKKCYACNQWDGNRTFDHTKKKVRVDQASSGNCRILRKPVKGRECCDNFFPLQ
jgi:hypothetical protein